MLEETVGFLASVLVFSPRRVRSGKDRGIEEEKEMPFLNQCNCKMALCFLELAEVQRFV